MVISMRRRREKLVKISVRVTEFELKCLEKIVKQGYFESVAAAIRAAVENMLRKYLIYATT